MHEKRASDIEDRARAIAPLSAPAAHYARTHDRAYRFGPPSDFPSRRTRRFRISKQAGISIRACRATRDRIGPQMVFIGGVTSTPAPPSTDSTPRPFLVRSPRIYRSLRRFSVLRLRAANRACRRCRRRRRFVPTDFQ